MEPKEVAKIALDWLKDRSNAEVMVAVMVAESNLQEGAMGDPVYAGLDAYAPFACDGYLSFGLGQVFLGVHTDMVRKMSGLTTPCELAHWLKDPDNNMRACHAILANQGFPAWTAYKTGAYLRYFDLARAAVTEALAGAVEPPVPPAPAARRRIQLQIPLRFQDSEGRSWQATLQLDEE